MLAAGTPSQPGLTPSAFETPFGSTSTMPGIATVMDACCSRHSLQRRISAGRLPLSQWSPRPPPWWPGRHIFTLPQAVSACAGDACKTKKLQRQRPQNKCVKEGPWPPWTSDASLFHGAVPEKEELVNSDVVAHGAQLYLAMGQSTTCDCGENHVQLFRTTKRM